MRVNIISGQTRVDVIDEDRAEKKMGMRKQGNDFWLDKDFAVPRVV